MQILQLPSPRSNHLFFPSFPSCNWERTCLFPSFPSGFCEVALHPLPPPILRRRLEPGGHRLHYRLDLGAWLFEAMEHKVKKDLPRCALLLADVAGEKKPKPALNLLVRQGVRSCLEYAKNFDLKRARSLSNRELAPHLEFVDWEDTDTRRCDCQPMRCAPSSSASRALFRGATNRTAARSTTASRITRNRARKARDRFWFSTSSSETRTYASNVGDGFRWQDC